MKFLALTASALILAAACSQPDSEPTTPVEDTGNTTIETQDAEAGDASPEAIVSEDGFRLTPVAAGLEFRFEVGQHRRQLLVSTVPGFVRRRQPIDRLIDPVLEFPQFAHVNAPPRIGRPE